MHAVLPHLLLQTSIREWSLGGGVGWERWQACGEEASVFIVEERLTQESNPLSGQLVMLRLFIFVTSLLYDV